MEINVGDDEGITCINTRGYTEEEGKPHSLGSS